MEHWRNRGKTLRLPYTPTHETEGDRFKRLMIELLDAHVVPYIFVSTAPSSSESYDSYDCSLRLN